MKILVLGDIVAKIGREAVKQTLPNLRNELSPDIIIANCENLAQGKGITTKTIDEMLEAGVDMFTGGNHIWTRKEAYDILSDPRYSDVIVRPANYPQDVPGKGWNLFTVGAKSVLVINFLGRVFSGVLTEDPFRLFDKIIAETANRRPYAVLVDFHGEATSEKIAFGWHADGRAAAIWGTHTHVPTRDERVLPGGTAYITDIGMTGFRDGVIGVDRTLILRNFMTQLPVRHEFPSSGEAVVNAALITVGEGGQATAIEHIQKRLTIS
ncbi:MAG: TIGR00282 family metallophosphoesterase [Patescibacteria group bacterium]|nr:TIGR00282 family metallophosphoesterase [Patescibacteria group bacterium]